jgi:lipid-A-disaccharide synthase-like uncharacterized protein
MKLVREHMHDMHSSLTWIVIGLISLIFGIIRTVKQIWCWIAEKRKKKDVL